MAVSAAALFNGNRKIHHFILFLAKALAGLWQVSLHLLWQQCNRNDNKTYRELGKPTRTVNDYM